MPAAAPLTAESLPLRDIHLPAAISWWPPAPGWWLLLLAFLLLFCVCFWLLRRRRRRHYRRLALHQLQTLEQQYQQPEAERQLLQALSRLLRQSAQLHYPQAVCAGLVGPDWLQFLDQQLGGEDFSQGCGQVLALGPYLPQTPEVDTAALLTLCRRWLRGLPLAPKAVRRLK